MKQVCTSTIALIILLGLVTQSTVHAVDESCEQCGMTVDEMGQARFNIVDAGGTRHYACCPICALKLVKTYGELNITSFCDYNGPSFPITIKVRKYGSLVTVNPTSALIVLGGSCAKNRIVYSAAAADALLAPPNNGTSQWLSPLTNETVTQTSPRTGIAEAALKHGGGVACPCDQCSMTVDTIGQARFRILDSNGTTHIACCPVCALKLVKTYGQLNVSSYCDQYGPSYPIRLSIKQYGCLVQAIPSSVLVIIGGSCAKNRIVYNSTAADELLSPPNNGTSQWLSPLSNSTVASNATRMGIAQAALKFGGGPDRNSDGFVNILDIWLIARQFGRPPPPIEDFRADINTDGIIDILDLTIVAIYFGETI